MRCRNFFRLMTICNLCQVARNMYTLKFGGGILETQCITRQKKQKFTDQSYLILSIANLLVDVYRISIVESHIGILLHWP